MHCIVVDDEPKALDVIAHFIARISFLTLGEQFRDSIQALEYLGKSKPDLLFLDINMPDLDGFQLLKALPQPPMVIFTTAYSEFAVESYELNAVDYLLKPIEFERFLKAVMKARQMRGLPVEQPSPSAPLEATRSTIFIKSGTKSYRIALDEVLYVEGMGNYVRFVLPNQKVVSYMSLSEAMELLPPLKFSRIHKSFIVSHAHIDLIETHQVKVSGYPIPIGSTFREEFLKRIALDKP
jgi:two-component system, LytTR family, response regulator